jgi:hypothetical protein
MFENYLNVFLMTEMIHSAFFHHAHMFMMLTSTLQHVNLLEDRQKGPSEKNAL